MCVVDLRSADGGDDDDAARATAIREASPLPAMCLSTGAGGGPYCGLFAEGGGDASCGTACGSAGGLAATNACGSASGLAPIPPPPPPPPDAGGDVVTSVFVEDDDDDDDNDDAAAAEGSRSPPLRRTRFERGNEEFWAYLATCLLPSGQLLYTAAEIEAVRLQYESSLGADSGTDDAKATEQMTAMEWYNMHGAQISRSFIRKQWTP